MRKLTPEEKETLLYYRISFILFIIAAILSIVTILLR